MGNVRMRAEQINYGASNVKVALDDLDPKDLIALSERMSTIEDWKATVKAEEKTGAEVTFTNALALDAVSLSTEIEPIQDLHGYDHPWVGGAGLNKCNPDAVALVTSDTETQRYGLVFDAAGTYTLSASVNLASGELDIRKFSDDTYTWVGALVTANAHNTFTEAIESGEKLILFGPLSMDLNAVKSALTDAKVMVESGSTAHTYAPYSNICPISGRTSNTISQTDADEQTTTVTIQLGQTVYGGTLNVTTGVVTVNKTGQRLLSSFNWGLNESAGERRFQYHYDTAGILPIAGSGDGISSHFEFLRTNVHAFGTYYINSGWLVVPDKDSAIASLDAFKTWLDNNEVYICYPLATPTTIQLTPTMLTMLKGYNRLSADTGDITVEAYTGAAWGGDEA